MSLIEDIEAAADAAFRTSSEWPERSPIEHDELMLDLTIDNVWKRIRAALEAADKMERFIIRVSTNRLTYNEIDEGNNICNEYRAAMKGKHV